VPQHRQPSAERREIEASFGGELTHRLGGERGVGVRLFAGGGVDGVVARANAVAAQRDRARARRLAAHPAEHALHGVVRHRRIGQETGEVGDISDGAGH